MSGGHDCKLQHFGAESNQKKTEFFLCKYASGPPTFLVGHKDFLLSLNNFLLHPFSVLLPITHYGEKTYIA